MRKLKRFGRIVLNTFLIDRFKLRYKVIKQYTISNLEEYLDEKNFQ